MSGETRLEQLLLLAKGTRGLATAKVVQQATEEPSVFVFGELLDLPQLQEKSGDTASVLALLQLFAYGTWPEYRASLQGSLPLSERQQVKLKQLTVASLASEHKIVPYALLKDALDLHDERQLEDFLITSCIYAGVLSGRLDQRRQCLRTHSTIARDLRREDVGAILAGYHSWAGRCRETVTMLETQIAHAKQAAAQNAQTQAAMDNAVAEAKKGIKGGGDNDHHASLAAGSEPEPMDLLEEDRLPNVRQKRRR